MEHCRWTYFHAPSSVERDCGSQCVPQIQSGRVDSAALRNLLEVTTALIQIDRACVDRLQLLIPGELLALLYSSQPALLQL